MAERPPRQPGGRPTSRDFIEQLYAPLRNKKAAVSEKPVDGFHIGKEPDEKPVYLFPDQLSTHLHIVGGSGKGKSNFLRRLAQQLLIRRKKTGEGFAIIDPHGTLAQYTLELCGVEAPLLAKDTVYFDLKQAEKVLSINPLRRGDADPYFVASCVKEGLLKAFGEVRAQDKPLISKMLGNLVEVLLHQGLSLTDFRYFLYRGQGDHAVFQHNIEQLPQGDLRSFWENFDQLPATQADMYSMGPSNRLEPLVKSKPLRRMLGHTDVSLDFKALMDDGGIAIFDLSREGAGVTVDGQHLLAALLVQEFRQVLETRTPDVSRPFTLILDEFGDYTSADFARVLTAARKFGMRCVFSHQHMGQLLLADQDRTLFDAVLAIPNKVMFGGLPFDQAELLAKQTYLQLLSADKIQYQPQTIVWDPVPTKVTLTAKSRGESETEGSGGSAGRSGGTSSSTATSVDADGKSATSSASGGNESATESSQWSFTNQKTWNESEHEAWVTFYKKRIQDGTPVFEDLEKQVFRFAQKLNVNPKGTCVVATAETLPRECRVPLMKPPGLSAVEKKRYLEWVYDKPFYLDPAEADRRIEARQKKLLEAAPPAEGRVKKKPKPS